MGELNTAGTGGAGARGMIDDDRACADCGYNLMGLQLNGKCPECGTPISPSTMVRSARPCKGCGFDVDGLRPGESCPRCGMVLQSALPFGKMIALGEAPRPWLGVLRTGCALMAVGGIAFSVLPAIVFLWSEGDQINGFIDNLTAPPSQAGGPHQPIPHGFLVFVLALATSICWAVGVWLMSRPRPQETYTGDAYRPSAEWLTLRWLARGGAALGTTSAFLLGWWIETGSSTSASLWIIVVGLSVVPSLYYLSGLLLWAGDDGMAWATRGGGTLVGAMGVLLLVSPFRVLTLLGGMAFVLGVASGQWASFRMESSIRWASRHADNAAALEARRKRKAEEEQARMAEAGEEPGTEMSAEQLEALEALERKQAEMEAAGEGKGNGEPAGPASSGRQHRIESSGDVETFGLEGDGGGQ